MPTIDLGPNYLFLGWSLLKNLFPVIHTKDREHYIHMVMFTLITYFFLSFNKYSLGTIFYISYYLKDFYGYMIPQVALNTLPIVLDIFSEIITKKLHKSNSPYNITHRLHQVVVYVGLIILVSSILIIIFSFLPFFIK